MLIFVKVDGEFAMQIQVIHALSFIFALLIQIGFFFVCL
jgi:hypothetical protein